MKQNNHLVQNLSIYDIGIIENHALDNDVIDILITRGGKDFYFYQTVFFK